MLVNTPQSLAESLPFYAPAWGLTISADARIDNREELFARLAIPADQQNAIPDSQLILQAYGKWGRDCAAHLLGDFAFAIWDEGEQRLFCARDHLGHKPLFYHCTNDAFIFATEMKGLFAATALPRTLNQSWVADALTVLMADNEYTPYQAIWRLPPAHWFAISAEEFTRETYWRLDPAREICLPSEADYVEAFREKLTEAVRCRVRSVFPIGSELSGGLDSSTVAGLAARQTQADGIEFTTFSHVLGETDRAPGDSVRG